MAKVEFKKLPMGVALEPSHFYTNVQSVVTELNANRIEEAQRQETRAVFTMTWTTHRGNGLGSFFSLPPLQEYWATDTTGANLLDTSAETPIPRLEALIFSFDVANSNQGLTDGTTLLFPIPTAARPFTQDAIVTIKRDDQIIVQSRILQAELDAENATIGQRPNPQALANLGIDIDPYGVYMVHFQAPLPTGVDSVVIQAVFSHPVVERDTSAIIDTYVLGAGNVAQNAPLHDLARDPAAYSITPAVVGQAINADGASGVQTVIETMDDVFRKRLRGGLEPYSTVVKDEVLKENQGYFCDVVPLFKTSTGVYQDAGGFLGKFTVRQTTTTFHDILYDRAIIPLTQPFTLHHAMISLSGLVVGTQALVDREIEVGVGLLSGVRTEAANYTQMAYRKFNLATTSGVVGKVMGTVSGAYLWSVPVVYSTPAAINGQGYMTNGRPFYGGRQRATAAGLLRRNSASYNALLAEGAPPTNGAEQYLEVRIAMRALNGGSVIDWPNAAPDNYTVCSQSGLNVYLVGKRALGV